jgi:nucleotidyltransferase substrate binding protein (TIGR01987 family)
MIIDGIDITSLLKASKILNDSYPIAHTQLEQMGVVQGLKITFELCWKTMKRLLEARGKILNSPREVIRAAALENFIIDPEIWFIFLKKRNLTVHSYNQEYLEDIIQICPSFSHEVMLFLKNIGIKNAH